MTVSPEGDTMYCFTRPATDKLISKLVTKEMALVMLWLSEREVEALKDEVNNQHSTKLLWQESAAKADAENRNYMILYNDEMQRRKDYQARAEKSERKKKFWKFLAACEAGIVTALTVIVLVK